MPGSETEMTSFLVNKTWQTLRFLPWIFLLALLWAETGGDAALPSDDVARMEELASKAMKLVEKGQRHDLSRALNYLEESVAIFEASNHSKDDSMQGSSLFVYDKTRSLYVTYANNYDLEPSKQRTLSQAESHFQRALKVAEENGFGMDARMHFWNQLGKTKSLQKADCAAASY